MHWTPLSGAKFEDVFGPSGKSTRCASRPRRGKARPKVEHLEVRTTPAITAGIVASSLASTPDPNVTIGEIVRQRVVVSEPLSGNFDPTAFNVQALLPAGMQLLPGTADIALVSANGITSTLDPNNTGGLNVTGANVDVTTVHPTFLLPASAISTDPTTGAVFFNTGIAHANDDGSTQDYIVIEFNALVTNVTSNQAETPTNLTTNFHVFIGGTTCNCLGTDTVTVVEPTITDLNKAAHVSDDGTSATYTLTFSNTGNSTAYDVRVVDNVPAGLTLDPASVQVVGGTGVTNRSTATTLDVTLDSLAVGGQVTITYTTAIAASARNGQTITNTVNLDYTSLPGPNGTSPNPTGSVTPGDSGSPTGERNGSGGVNDYFDSAQANIAVQSAPRPNSISGFVFVDENHSGDFDAGDTFVAGAVIRLQDANGNPVTDLNGNVVAPITTGANGAFSFANLPDGVYQLVEDFDEMAHMLMDGNDFPGLLNGVQDTTAQSDASPGDRIFNIHLTGGVAGTQYRFGECPCPPEGAMLSGFVYEDFTRGVFNAPTKNNGIFNSTELGIAGVTVTLTDANGNPVTDLNGNVVGPTVTDATGFYQFTNLAAGSYRVVETQPPIYTDGKDTPGTTGGTVGPNQGVGTDFITAIPLAAGDNSQNNNFGELFQQVNGFVYEDFTRGNLTLPTFNNGHFDAGELGIPGATVDLFIKTPAGFLFQAETTTNAGGEYFFTNPSAFTQVPSGTTTLAGRDAAVVPLAAVAPPNLAPGTYAIVETQPAGYVDGKDTPGTSGGVVGPNQGVGTDFITDIPLALAGDSLNNDFGELPQGNVGALSLSGHVYFDANKNCVFDAGDRAVPGARLHLFLTSGPGGPVEVAQTTTNNLGQYLFEIDTPGTYMVTEDNVAGLIKECAVPGTVNGVRRGTAPAIDDLANIGLVNGDAGINYNFFLITNTPPPPPFSKQQLLANLPNGSGLGTGVAGATAFATTPSFANIGGLGDDNIMAVGADAGGPPTVRVFDFTTGKTLFQFNAYDTAFRGGVRVAVADINGDGTPDVITAPGASGGPHIKVFDGKTGALIRQFMAYAPTFTGGVYVAAGDVNGDGVADIITGAGAGGGPHVKVFDGKTGQVIGSFLAYAPTFAGGVRVAAGDFNQDGRADIVTGAGPGGGPHVKIFNAATLGSASPAVLRQFFAFAPNFTGGVNVAANAFGQGDLTGDGRTDLVVGTGSGAGQVKVIDGASFATVSNFTAFDSSLTTRGVRVGVFDLNGDGRGDVVTATGGGGPLGSFVRVVDLNNSGGDLDFFQAFNPASLGGAFVAVG